jgi:SulP family sulfate permease
MLMGGVALVGYVPRFVLGGLLMQLGGQLIWNWCIASRRRLPTLEWLLVPVVVVATAWFGVLSGFAVGILGGCAIFAFGVSRVDIVHRQFGADERPSSFVRSTDELALLRDQGHTVHIIELASFIFFGSAYRLQEQVAALVATRHPRMVVFDFSSVDRIDSSAGSSLLRISQRLREAGIRHVVSGLSPLVRAVMVEAGALAGVTEYADLDQALEAGETLLLVEHGFKTAEYPPLVDWFTEALGSAAFARDLIAVLEPAHPVDAEYLCRQGDPTDSLLFVERGRVSVLVDRPGHAPIRHRVFGANTVLGEVGFFLDVPRTADLKQDPGTRVWALSRPAFERLQRDQPALTAALLVYTIRTQAERLSFATRQIAALQR